MFELEEKQTKLEMITRSQGITKAVAEMEHNVKVNESNTKHGSKLMKEVFDHLQELCAVFVGSQNKRNIFLTKYYHKSEEFFVFLTEQYKDARQYVSHPYNLVPFVLGKELTKHIHQDIKLTTVAKVLLDTMIVSYNLNSEIKNNEIASTAAFVRSMVEQCPLLEIYHNHRSAVCIRFRSDILESATKAANEIKPHILFEPMICPPIDHKSLNDSSGGYLTLHSPLMKRPDKSVINSDFDVRVLNEIQSTAYRINKPLIDLIDNLGLTDIVIPENINEVIVAKQRLSRDLRYQAKRSNDEITRQLQMFQADILEIESDQQISSLSKDKSVLRTVELIRKFKDYDKLWFPIFADTRCRIYNYCTDLNVQGTKLGKYVLELAEGEVMSYEGYEQLLYALGGVLGYDKHTYEIRKQKAIEVLPLIDAMFEKDDISIVDLISNDGDEIYYGLGLIIEIYKYRTIPFYVSHFIIYVDSCASGTQITGLITKSLKSAELSNIVNPNIGQTKLTDAYITVAEEMKDQYEKISSMSNDDLKSLLHDELEILYKKSL